MEQDKLHAKQRMQRSFGATGISSGRSRIGKLKSLEANKMSSLMC